MNKHILFWGVPLVLAAAIGVLFYQLYLNGNDTLNSILEQDFQNLFSQETSVETPVSQMKEKGLQPPMKNETLISKDSGEKGVEKPSRMVMATSKKEMKGEMVDKMAKSEKPKSRSSKTFNQLGEPTELASLIEKDQNIWESISRSQSKKLTSDQWRTIIIQNKRKLDYTIFPEVYDTKRHWDIIQKQGKLEVNYVAESPQQPHPVQQSDLPQDNAQNDAVQKDVPSNKNPWKYVVQVMSTDLPYYEHAAMVAHRLVSDGYYAYVYRTKDKIKEKLWYRVRVGYFKTPEDARAMGQEIYFRYRDQENFLPQSYWAVVPSEHELSREVVNINTQKSKPWVLELPLYKSRTKTLKDLPKLEEITELAYVSSQKQGKTMYFRIRSGFYKTEAEAQRKLATLKKIHPSLGTPKIIKL